MGTWFLVTVIMGLMPTHYANPFVFKATVPAAFPFIVNVFTFSQLQVTPTSKGVDKELVGARVAWKQWVLKHPNQTPVVVPYEPEPKSRRRVLTTLSSSQSLKRIQQAHIKTWNLYVISFV